MAAGKGNYTSSEPFHVIHKVPFGDGPYVRGKHAQLVEKDGEAAIVWFWKAINEGDRVDSALKDMAVVMKQLDRAEEAIQAIYSFRHLCSNKAQDSLDNLLIDLYKKCGMIEEQIELLKQKLRMISQGEVINGRTTKTARCHGKKIKVSIKHDVCRILGNLGWAYMQQSNYQAAEAVYRKALMIEPDGNKGCNLALCLMKEKRVDEARDVLLEVLQGQSQAVYAGEDKSLSRALELLSEIGTSPYEGLDLRINEWTPSRSRRLPIFEEISSFQDQLAC